MPVEPLAAESRKETREGWPLSSWRRYTSMWKAGLVLISASMAAHAALSTCRSVSGLSLLSWAGAAPAEEDEEDGEEEEEEEEEDGA